MVLGQYSERYHSVARDIDDKVDRIENNLEDVKATVNNIDKELALHKASLEEQKEHDTRAWDELKRMNDILQQNTNSLNEHMRRTDILEDMVQRFDTRFSPIELSYIEQKVIDKYILDRKAKIKSALIFLTKVAGAIGAVITLYMTLKSISGL